MFIFVMEFKTLKRGRGGDKLRSRKPGIKCTVNTSMRTKSAHPSSRSNVEVHLTAGIIYFSYASVKLSANSYLASR